MRPLPRGFSRAALAAAVLLLPACTSLFGIDEGELASPDAGADAPPAQGEAGGSSDATVDQTGGDASNQGDGGGTDAGGDHTVPPGDGSGGDATGASDAPGADGAAGDGATADGTQPESSVPDASGTGKVGTLGGSCSQNGATACNGNDSQVVLLCQNGTWAASGSPCPSNQRCDSTVGACGNVAAGCSGLNPGDTFCGTTSGGAAAIEQCGVDLVTTTVVQTCGPHQSCTGTAPSLACTCNADPQCTVAGGACNGSSTLVTCAADSQGCVYTSGTQACSNGACYGSAGSAQCCTNQCAAAGTTCQGETPVTCATGTGGCLELTQGTACSGGTPTCANGQCTAACGGDGGTCGAGYCCSSSTCVAWTNTMCGPTCYDCVQDPGYGTACLSNGSCGCNTSSDCTAAASYAGGACLSTQICGCNTTSDCGSSTAGHGCVNGRCGCSSASDCSADPGGCCAPAPYNSCYAYASTEPGSTNVCSNGSWVPPTTVGAPCQDVFGQPTSTCGSGLCCDYALTTGQYGQCISGACPGNECGGQDQDCCPASSGPQCRTGYSCNTAATPPICQ